MDKDEIWSTTLSILLTNTDEEDPKPLFLNKLSPVGIFGDQFVLLAESTAVESWVRKNYLDEIQETLQQVSDTPLNVGLGANSSQPQTQPQAAQFQTETPINPVIQIPSSIPVEPIGSNEPDWLDQRVDPSTLSKPSNSPLDNSPHHQGSEKIQANNQNIALFMKCSFDNFIVGPSNEFARGAALAVAEAPGVAYNPLFIYGGSGLGKTHLLVAIANYVQQNYPSMKVCYVSADIFLSDYVEATQKNQWASFRNKYHQMDVLLVDDVQYLEGKDGSINQLFNIFNEMKNGNKQIVLSADRAPKDIDMDVRMTSRFISGVLADVKPPDYETRLAILKNYLTFVSQQTNFYGNIPDEVLEYLAEIATSNIRDMEGSITKIASNMAMFKKDTITVEETQELIKDFFPTIKDKKIDIPLIQSEVEKMFGITHEDMISDKRSKSIVRPRHIAIYLSRYLTDESLEAIGKKFGGRDHTTVMHSLRKIENDEKEDRQLYDQLENLWLTITGKNRG